MYNRFRKYNTSLFVNVLMNSKYYKYILKKDYIPNYDDINKKDEYGNFAVGKCYAWGVIEIARLLLSHPDIDKNDMLNIFRHIESYDIVFGLGDGNNIIANITNNRKKILKIYG